MTTSLPLLIPIENQVRELDPKLLLAVAAAKAGFKSYIGYRTEMDISITSLPRGIYIAKSFTKRSDKMFRILSKLGHVICAWDEEALVHYPPDIYFTRRLSATALSYVSYLFAWGKENEELFKSYPQFPLNLPVYTAGNPRLDLLRKQFTGFYQDEISHLKQQYGKFILINTNFGNVNAHLPYLNLFTKQDEKGNYKIIGRGAVGMSLEFAHGRAKYKQALFEHFLSLVPYLSASLNDVNIIIRPHPIENQQPYHDLASKCKNVKVVQQGNVIPWIRAAGVLVHSGCTTGIEAFISDKPAIAYVPLQDQRFGHDAILPNQLSYNCSSKEEVIAMINRILNGDPPKLNNTLLEEYIDFDQATLCSSKIVSIIAQQINASDHDTSAIQKAHGWLLANKRRIIKRIKGKFPSSKYHKSFQEVRFPSLNEHVLDEKIESFTKILGMTKAPNIKQVSPHIFLVQ